VHKTQEGAQHPSDRQEEEIWTIGFHIQKESGGAHRKKDGSELSDLIKLPVIRWIGRESRMV
jgi:hypothetical protein